MDQHDEATFVTSCPGRDQLAAFSAGKLGGERFDTIAEHLSTCDECLEQLTRLDDKVDTLVSELRKPGQSYLGSDEDRRRIVEMVAAIGRDPSVGAVQAAKQDPPPELDIKELGPYRFLAKLGQGGMGAVYKALHTRLEKVVAVKVLPADRMQDEAAVARFDREMRAVGKLDHANIVRATDADEDDGMHYLVMEYVNGCDLSELVKSRGPLPVAEACELIRQAAQGLAHANEHGLVHRDIKPSNLMLTRKGTVKILDMGLALLDEPHIPAGEELTHSGQLMGTIDYMAPEQGQDTHGVDIRADIYSLGATFYKLLTGTAPFANEKYATVMKKLMALIGEEPTSVTELRAEVPAELVSLIERMLAKDPAARIATPEEVARALEPFAVGADLRGLLATATGTIPADDPTHTDTSVPVRSSLSATDARVESRVSASSEAATEATVLEQPGSRPAESVTQLTTPATEPAGGRIQRFFKSRLTLGGFAAALLLGVIITIATKNGTVVVEGPDGKPLPDDVTVFLTGDDEKIEISAKDQWTVRAAPEEFLVTVRDSQDRLIFSGESLTVQRFGRTVLRVTLKPTAVPDVAETSGSSPNYALQFDGESSYVSIDSLPLPDEGAVTFEAFATPANRNGYQSVVDATNAEQRLSLFRDSSVWDGRVWSNSKLKYHSMQSQGGLFLDGQTQKEFHVAVVWDGRSQDVLLFTNGVRHSRDASKVFEQPPHRLGMVIGVFSELDGAFFEGTIDEVRISNVARYTEEFEPPKPDERFQSDEHTLALYHFDEGSGVVALDSSGNGHHGKIVGAKWLRVSAPSSQVFTERQVAEWVLERGGNVRGSVDGNAFFGNKGNPIPATGAVSIENVSLYRIKSITDGDLARFDNLPKLQHLGLGSCPVGDEGVGHLASLTTLRLLYLDQTRITDQGIRHIAGLKNLQLLRLNSNEITDQGLNHLKGLSQLKSLLIGGTLVTEAGVKDLANALPNCRIQFTSGGEYKSIGPIGVATSPFDHLRREEIDPYELSVAGLGDPDQAPPELVAVYGDSRLRGWGSISLRLSADESKLLTFSSSVGRDEQIICVWDRAKSRQLHQWHGRKLILSRDRTTAVLWELDGTTSVWNLSTLARTATISLAASAPPVVSPGGEFLALQSDDGSRSVWKVGDDEQRFVVPSNGKAPGRYFFDATPDLLAVDLQGETQLWDLASGKARKQTLPGTPLAFSPDGTLLLVQTARETLTLYAMPAGEERHRLTVPADHDASFSPDGKSLLVAYWKPMKHRAFQLWDPATGKLRHELVATYGPTGRARFLSNGKYLIALTFSGTSPVWDTMTGKEIERSKRRDGISMIFEPLSGELSFLGNISGWAEIHYFDLEQKSAVAHDADVTPRIGSVVVSGGGRRLAFGMESKLEVVDLLGENGLAVSAPRNESDRLVASPDGKFFVNLTSRGKSSLWDAVNGQSVAEFSTTYVAADFSPDGATLALLTKDGAVTLWSVEQQQEIKTHASGDAAWERMQFHPSGELLVVGRVDQQIALIDVETGMQRGLFEAGTAEIVVDPQGRRLAARAPNSRAISIHALPSGELRQKVQHMQHYPRSMAASPDGDILAVAYNNGDIHLLNAPGELQRQLAVHPNFGFARQIQFAPDGRHLITVNGNGTVYVLRLAEPPAAKPAAGSSVTAADGWIDLLPLVEPAKDSYRDGAKRVGDEVELSKTGGYSGVALPVSPTGDYELRVTFTRTDGGQWVALMLPTGSRRPRLVVDSENTHFCGIEGIRSAVGPETPLTNGKQYLLEVRVTHGPEQDAVQIAGSLDGEPIISWVGHEQAIATGDASWMKTDGVNWLEPGLLGVAAKDSQVRLHRIEFRMLDGTAKLERSAE